MAKYIGVKLVEAKSLNLGDYNAYRGWTIPTNENPLKDNENLRKTLETKISKFLINKLPEEYVWINDDENVSAIKDKNDDKIVYDNFQALFDYLLDEKARLTNK